MREAFDKLERQMESPLFRLTSLSVTSGNGGESSDAHGREQSVLTKGNRAALHFAHPYRSCERGTNENHNGIIRGFLPKGTDFALIKARKVKEILDWMNTHPRRILNGFTPLQSFREAFGLIGIHIKLLKAC